MEGTLGCLLQQSPKFYNKVFLVFDSTTLGHFVIGWLIKLSVQTFRVSLLGFATFYRPLSYPFRSLQKPHEVFIVLMYEC